MIEEIRNGVEKHRGTRCPLRMGTNEEHFVVLIKNRICPKKPSCLLTYINLNQTSFRSISISICFISVSISFNSVSICLIRCFLNYLSRKIAASFYFLFSTVLLTQCIAIVSINSSPSLCSSATIFQNLSFHHY